jgi:hypothetical protein
MTSFARDGLGEYTVLIRLDKLQPTIDLKLRGCWALPEADVLLEGNTP